MKKPSLSIPQVAVLIPLTLKGHLDVFNGILQYARLHGPWRLYRMEGRTGEQKLLDLKRWGCTGIIASQCSRAEAALIAKTRLPVVVSEPSPEMRAASHPFANKTCQLFDSRAIGRVAARFFLDRQYKNFAFVGDPHNIYWSKERGEAFKDAAEASGAVCAMYPAPPPRERHDWAIEQPRMQAWLKALPKPVALLAAMDGRARQVLDACMGAKISVPNDIAVLGVDDDPLICEATFPPLSSIQANAEKTGYLLAQHLDGLMRGKKFKKTVFPVTPTRVVIRRSTEANAIPDRKIARALEFIWREAGERNINVPEVATLIGASRRFAEIHFKNVVGRTIMEEIRHVKLERVCSLLTETNLTIGEITRQCGFARESHLACLFRKVYGLSMSAYRKGQQCLPRP
ncbi:MAG: DNA-binding transcriptional regulator [Kiritimatiellae bacterium]|nr:DNA-binding transcriptional regulator [Kiritimatiellia bacterium]